MQIIGEKINGTRHRVAKAIEGRDASYIRDLAVKQAGAGASWLDVNAGTRQSREAEDLIWLVETIQAAVDVPVCLDSANPQALAAAIEIVDRTPMINSVSGEPQRLEGILPLIAEHGCPAVALAMDETGIPPTSEGRMQVACKVMAAAREYGIAEGDIYFDPLVMSLATDTEGALTTLDTIRAIKREFPDANLTMGLSNVSFGLPARSRINQVFLVLAMVAGLDCVILDPLDRDLRAVLITAGLVLGRDRHCLNYTRAYRDGLLGDLRKDAVKR